jgi:hypothetical protein
MMVYFITTYGHTMVKNVDGGRAGITKMVRPEVGGDGEASMWS